MMEWLFFHCQIEPQCMFLFDSRIQWRWLQSLSWQMHLTERQSVIKTLLPLCLSFTCCCFQPSYPIDAQSWHVVKLWNSIVGSPAENLGCLQAKIPANSCDHVNHRTSFPGNCHKCGGIPPLHEQPCLRSMDPTSRLQSVNDNFDSLAYTIRSSLLMPFHNWRLFLQQQ